MTSRFAPTLFVGLGGSGAKVLGWLRKAILLDEDRDAPVVFRAIDFDEMQTSAAIPPESGSPEANENERREASGDDAPPLTYDQFQYFSPTPIANCVRAMRNRVLIGTDDEWKPAFEPILDWYPDPEGKSIRFAQVEAAGARQWRPLGRVGFFLYDSEIMRVVGTGLTELANRSSSIASAQSKTVVYIVTSVSGGTGAGILLDVAARIRHHHPNVAVRAVLLLPEFFKHVDIGGKILANAYATLWELSYLKNQHVIVDDVRYLRESAMDPRVNVPPLQRVYVVGPYVGDRQPFLGPQDAYAHVADMLKVMATETLRGRRVSQQANVDADGSASLDDPASRDLFCSFSGASIPLLSYADLARLIARRLALEATGKNGRALFDTLAPPLDTRNIDRIIRKISDLASTAESQKRLSETEIDQMIDRFLDQEYHASRGKWTVESLQELVTKLRRFCGDDPDGSVAETPQSVGLLSQACTAFRDELRTELRELRSLRETNPLAAREAIERILNHARRELDLKRVPPMTATEDFHTWLNTSWKWMLAVPILRSVRLKRLRDHAVQNVREYLRTQREPLFEQAIRNTAVEELTRLREEIRTEWPENDGFLPEVVRQINERRLLNTRLRERVAISIADADVVLCVKGLLGRIRERVLREDFQARVVGAFIQTYRTRSHNRNAAEDLPTAIENVLSSTAGVSPSAHISPSESYGNELIIRLIGKCMTPTFEIGRTESLVRHRSVRVAIPDTFPEHQAFDTFLRSVCESTLRATYQSSIIRNDHRILILVEDLFHPAEEIAGIYDYYADYARRPRPELFHSDKRYLTLLPPLLSSTGARGERRCGNPGCKRDISSVPREAIICPGCDRPIRGRCGNPKCSEDNLYSRPGWTNIVQTGRCPVCHGPLHTYWWTCPHHKKRVSTDKQHCPDCVREGRTAEKRPSGIAYYECPRCISSDASRPFRVESDIASACQLGVNGQKSHKITQMLSERLPGGTDCPRCGTRLVPVCPLGDDRYPHYLHRRDERSPWRCYTHPSQRFLTCHLCAFALLPGDKRCARCGSELDECRYCTPFRDLLIPSGTSGAPCPACGLRRDGPPADSERSGRGLFCANVYGCPAGRSLQTTRYPADHRSCPFCEETLRPAYTLDHHISACAVCRMAFPALLRPGQTQRADDRICVLCGMVHDETAAMNDAERLAAARTLRILVENERDEDAARILFESAASLSVDASEALRRFALRLRDRRRQRGAAERIDRILQIFQNSGIVGGSAPQRPQSGAAASEPELRTASARDDDELLLPDRILALSDEKSILAWVDTVFDRGISRERFEAALGSATSPEHDDLTRKRLEHTRERALARFAEREME